MARSIFATLLKWLTIGIGLSLATPAQAVDSNLYLIALAGQSNMTGAGDVKTVAGGLSHEWAAHLEFHQCRHLGTGERAHR